MPDLAQHLALRLDDDRVIAPTSPALRMLARCVLRVAAEAPLLAFRAADTHLHLLLLGSAAAACELARRIEISLQRSLRLGAPFIPTHPRPVRDQSHLTRSFFYVLRQRGRHGLASDPFHDGSNLPDLLGMRVLGLFTARHVRAHLQRVRREDLLAILERDLAAPLRSLDPLAEAAAAAACLPGPQGRARELLAARRAAYEAVGSMFLARDVARGLGLAPRRLSRLREGTASPALVRAVELQLRARQGSLAPEAFLDAAQVVTGTAPMAA